MREAKKPSTKVKRPSESITAEQRMRRLKGGRGKRAQKKADFIYQTWRNP